MTPNNKQQALVIEGATVLANHHGMAPGMLVKYENKHIILLPGPPKEMQPMVKMNYCLILSMIVALYIQSYSDLLELVNLKWRLC